VATRVKTRTVIFARPFFLDEVKRELPAGSYVVETDEETLDVSSFVAYRRVGTPKVIPITFPFSSLIAVSNVLIIS
jgi:hypothetical protein